MIVTRKEELLRDLDAVMACVPDDGSKKLMRMKDVGRVAPDYRIARAIKLMRTLPNIRCEMSYSKSKYKTPYIWRGTPEDKLADFVNGKPFDVSEEELGILRQFSSTILDNAESTDEQKVITLYRLGIVAEILRKAKSPVCVKDISFSSGIVETDVKSVLDFLLSKSAVAHVGAGRFRLTLTEEQKQEHHHIDEIVYDVPAESLSEVQTKLQEDFEQFFIKLKKFTSFVEKDCVNQEVIIQANIRIDRLTDENESLRLENDALREANNTLREANAALQDNLANLQELRAFKEKMKTLLD